MSDMPARIFIVEDEALIAMEIEDRLTRIGYSVCGRAKRGEEAVDGIAAADPDLVLMDINLAGEMTGIDVAERLRRKGDTPVVFLSAYSDEKLIARASEVQPFGYLVKPFEERELHATIQVALSRSRMEEALRKAQRMEAVGRLAGGIAHDLNNQLTVVIGNLDMLRDRAADDPGQIRQIDAALNGATRSAELTQGLLAFARKQPLSPSICDVGASIREVLPQIRATLREHIQVELSCQPDLWPVLIDEAQLKSCVVNLASNCRDAMPEGGTVTISVRNASAAAKHGKGNPGRGASAYVAIEVADTGAGMPEDVLAQAFEPFFTTKSMGRGAGLGLSMAHGFVKQSGGHIEIRSEVGRGTTVSILLPRA